MKPLTSSWDWASPSSVHFQLAHIQVRIYEDLCLLLGLSHPMLLCIASLITFRSTYMKIFASFWGWATHAPVHCQFAHIQVRILEDLCLLLRLSHPMLLCIASFLTFRSEYMKIFASSWCRASPCSCSLPACSHSGQHICWPEALCLLLGLIQPCILLYIASVLTFRSEYIKLFPPPGAEPAYAPVHCQRAHIQVRIHKALSSSWGWANPCYCLLPACSHSGQNT